MKKLSLATRRLRFMAVALVLSVATLLPTIFEGTASAAFVQVSARSVQMSTSAVSAAATTYKVKFTQASSTVKGMVVAFCSNSPIFGDSTCTAPSGFTLTGSPAITMITGPTSGTWVATSSSPFNVLNLTNTTTNSSITNIEFDITTVTNPSTLGTFYARIITYPNDTGGTDSPTDYAPGSECTTNCNYGGVAISTAAQLVVTAKVQESLTFCVYTSGSNCAGASGTAVTLGDGNGVLANPALSYQSTQAKFGLGSNATSGVVVNMKGVTLTSGANTITEQGACNPDSTNPVDEQFGMRISTPGSGVTAVAPYNCGSGSHGFQGASTNTTYGDQIASTASGTAESQSTMEFSAKASTATEAGIYTTTLTFIATGTY